MYVQALYERSVEIKRTASGLFNLGVTHYHLSEYFAECLHMRVERGREGV